MARRWTTQEEQRLRGELSQLYTIENKTISEIGFLLNLSESTIFDRLIRLGIKTKRLQKPHVNNKRTDIQLPEHSELLAEFIGIMLGDGHVSRFQATVTLGTKEFPYVQYVASLMKALFGAEARICTRDSRYHDVYIGSTTITQWLRAQGLVSNKVVDQVGMPNWILKDPRYVRACLRGFFDTDGSIYQLKFGVQLAFTNRSLRLLVALQSMLKTLGYKPSKVSLFRIYITRREEIERFFKEIAPANAKHQIRFRTFMRR